MSSDRPPHGRKDLESSTRPNAVKTAIAPIHPSSPIKHRIQRLCDELNNTTGLLDLLLGITAEVTGADDNGDLGQTALAEDLGVAEGQEVDDGGGVGLGAVQVRVTLLGGDKGPELYQTKKQSVTVSTIIASIRPF